MIIFYCTHKSATVDSQCLEYLGYITLSTHTQSAVHKVSLVFGYTLMLIQGFPS